MERVSLFLSVSLNQQGLHLNEGACLSFPLSPLSLNGHSLSLFLSLSLNGENGGRLFLYMNEDSMLLSMMIVTLSLSMRRVSLYDESLSLSLSMRRVCFSQLGLSLSLRLSLYICLSPPPTSMKRVVLSKGNLVQLRSFRRVLSLSLSLSQW